MHLSIKTDNGHRTINLDKSFFQSASIKRFGKSVTVTPLDKASDLVRDLEKNVSSYELFNEDKLIFKYEKESTLNATNGALETRKDNVQHRTRPVSFSDSEE